MPEFEDETCERDEESDDLEAELCGSAREAAVFLLPCPERSPLGSLLEGYRGRWKGTAEGRMLP